MQIKQSLKLKRQTAETNLPPKQQKQSNKRKNIAKQSHTNPDVKLLKINSQKNDKKNSKQKNTQTLHEAEIQKAFRVHTRNNINFQQCVLSLKLLGCQLHEKNGSAQLQTIWNNRNQNEIDFSTFQAFYYEINSKDSLQMNFQLFELLSQSKKMIELETLTKMAQSANWKGPPAEILSYFGTEGKISFQQFNKMMNLFGALN